MTFWCRIKQSQIRNLSNQFKVCCSLTKTPSLINQSLPIITAGASSAVESNRSWFLYRNPSQFGNNVRFFAAPVFQVKKKEEDDDDYAKGPRLNGAITSSFIRLVTDSGHEVVPRHEALRRAKSLNLDLVEVQRDAKPPVCKLMDYHKEKYQKELKQKERVKSKKSELSLRAGAHKEVRVAGKIEQKDLQMKANTIKRLLERGWRVKAMAMGNEDEDLGGLLSKLAVLIEDFCVVESGPLVERKQAYVIVRHAKFGPSKKGGKQKKIIVPPSTFSSSTETSSHSEENLDEEKSSVGDEEDTISETPAVENRYKREPVNRYKTGPANSARPAGQMDASKTEVQSPAPENRYKTTGPPNRYNSTGSENRVPPQRQTGPAEVNRYCRGPNRNNETQRQTGPAEVNRYSRGPNPNNETRRQTGPAEINRYSRGPNPNNETQRQNGPAEVNRYSRGPNPNNETQRQNGPAEVNRYRRGPNPNNETRRETEPAQVNRCQRGPNPNARR